MPKTDKPTASAGEQLLYSPKQAAVILCVSLSTLYELMLRGEIASIKLGRSRRIPRDVLESYVAKLFDEQVGGVYRGGHMPPLLPAPQSAN